MKTIYIIATSGVARLNILLMMKNVLFLSLLLLLASCSRDPITPNGGGNNNGNNSGNNNGDNNGGGNGGEENSKPYFTIEQIPDTIKTLTYWTFEYRFSTNVQDLSVTSSADWCEATRVGDFNIISIKAIEYLSQTVEQVAERVYPTPRECTVTITAGDVYKKTIVVIQEPDDAQIMHGIYYPIKLSSAGERVVKHITSTCISWSAKTDADWLKANKIDEHTLEIVSTPRPDNVTTPREATITLTSDLNYRVTSRIEVKELESSISAVEYGYGENTPWD